MFALIGNIVAYTMSEDYRFFLKKLKYREEIVYEEPEIRENLSIWREEIEGRDAVDTLKDEILGRSTIESSQEWYTFIDIISWNNIEEKDEEIPELTWSQEQFIEIFQEYNLQKLSTSSSLFDITTEYPDFYYDYYSEDLSIYVFPTKTYEEVKKIFEVLRFELPYTLNEVNNFWQASFYINLENVYRDETVRIVLKHKNKAFWLKIKKDSYNAIKTLLEENL